MKITRLNYDVVDEVVNGDLTKVASIVQSMGDEYRNSYIPTHDEMSNMPEENFAVVLYDKHDGFIPKYAMHNKESAAFSIRFLEEKLDDIPDEIIKVAATNLKKACKHFKLQFPESLDKYAEKAVERFVNVNEIDKKAFYQKTSQQPEISEYALVEKKRFPIQTDEQIKKAEAYWDVYANEMDLHDRLEFAKNVAKKSDHAGIQKYAEIDINRYNEQFVDLLQVRRNYVVNEEISDMYAELGEKYAEFEPKKSFQLLCELDKMANLQYYYDRKIMNPVLTVFSGVEKIAEYESDGEIFTEDDLATLNDQDTSEWLDRATHEALQKEDGAEVFQSLPKPTRLGLFKLMGK